MQKRSLEDCVYKVKANISNYVTQDQEKCRDCCGERMYQCERYKPLKVTSIPIKYGKVAYLYGKQFFYKNISLKSLPHESE